MKFVDPLITKKEKEHLKRAFNSGWLSFGPYVEKFEKKLSNTLGWPTTGSGRFFALFGPRGPYSGPGAAKKRIWGERLQPKMWLRNSSLKKPGPASR